MENNQKMQHGNYEYQIVTYRKENGMYQGVIQVTAHAGIPYFPIVEIPTPCSLKRERAAWIEASALACQLIETGAMIALVPQDGNSSSWPLASESSSRAGCL